MLVGLSELTHPMKGIEATSEHGNKEKVIVETRGIGDIKECLKMRGPEWRLTTYGVGSKLLGTANGGLHRSIRSGSCKIRKEVLEKVTSPSQVLGTRSNETRGVCDIAR